MNIGKKLKLIIISINLIGFDIFLRNNFLKKRFVYRLFKQFYFLNFNKRFFAFYKIIYLSWENYNFGKYYIFYEKVQFYKD